MKIPIGSGIARFPGLVPTQQHFLIMLFIAYGGVQPLAGLAHVCSCLFNEPISDLPTGWPHENGPTNVGAMVKATNVYIYSDQLSSCFSLISYNHEKFTFIFLIELFSSRKVS